GAAGGGGGRGRGEGAAQRARGWGGGGGGGGGGGRRARPPVAVDVHGPARPGDHGVAGRQHLHRRGQGARRRDVLEGQVPAQPVTIQCLQFAGLGERFALGGEPQQPLAPWRATVGALSALRAQPRGGRAEVGDGHRR